MSIQHYFLIIKECAVCMLPAIHPHPLSHIKFGVDEMRQAEQEEERRKNREARFFCLVFGVPTIIGYGVLIYMYVPRL